MLFKKKQNQQNEKPNQQSPPENLSEQLKNLSNLSPNLAPTDTNKDSDIHARSDSIVKISKIIVFLIQASFIFLLLVNLSTAISNNRLERDIEELESELATNVDVETEAIQLIQRINLYKNLQENKQPVSNNINTVVGQVPSTIEIRKIEYQKDKVKFIGASPDVLSFALLITRYLELENVREVSLISANLTNTRNNREFVVTLEIAFK